MDVVYSEELHALEAKRACDIAPVSSIRLLETELFGVDLAVELGGLEIKSLGHELARLGIRHLMLRVRVAQGVVGADYNASLGSIVYDGRPLLSRVEQELRPNVLLPKVDRPDVQVVS